MTGGIGVSKILEKEKSWALTGEFYRIAAIQISKVSTAPRLLLKPSLKMLDAEPRQTC